MATAADLRRAAEEELQNCDFFQCFCCWRRHCSPRIPRVLPSREYICIPARAGDHAMWSVLIGCTSPGEPSHNLRLHRFNVDASGRVFGRSNDLLERFCKFAPDNEDGCPVHPKPSDFHSEFSDAKAALGSNGRYLHIICAHRPVRIRSSALPSPGARADRTPFPPKVFSLILPEKYKNTLPPLPFQQGSYEAISVHGNLWVPVIFLCSDRVTWRLSVYLLVSQSRSWDEVISVDFPYKRSFESVPDIVYGGVPKTMYGGGLLQGYAVIRDRFILLSFINSSFFCFDCTAGTLTPVATDGKSETHQYVPILGKGVHFPIFSRAGHVTGRNDAICDAICFIRSNKLFVYMYTPEEGGPLAAPLEIDTLWPYHEKGNGFVVHLDGGILCAVWINMRKPCGCSARHVLITTFRVRGITRKTGHIVPHGVEVVHSTCRRIDMLRSEAAGYECNDNFCFLQEYVDHRHPNLSWTRGPQVQTIQKMGHCCREFLSSKPRGVTDVIELEDCKVATRSDLYFICQVDQRSLVYQISMSDGKLSCHEKVLEALLCLDTHRSGDVRISDPPEWYFVHHGSKLDVIPSSPDCDHYMVDIDTKSYKLQKSKRSKLYFSAVFRVGQHIVSLCYTFQDVYVLNRKNSQWRHQKTTSNSIDMSRKVNISGFVDLGNDTFMISDADTIECFLFDLRSGEWFAVGPPRAELLQYPIGLLNGRCIFAEGFIYTFSHKYLTAFEVIHNDTSYCLGSPILLDFSWKKIGGDRKFISFDSICKGQILDSIAFCVVQGYFKAARSTSSHTLASMTIQVKLKETARGTKEPIKVGHVDISLSSIHEKGGILTNYAFAV